MTVTSKMGFEELDAPDVMGPDISLEPGASEAVGGLGIEQPNTCGWLLLNFELVPTLGDAPLSVEAAAATCANAACFEGEGRKDSFITALLGL